MTGASAGVRLGAPSTRAPRLDGAALLRLSSMIRLLGRLLSIPPRGRPPRSAYDISRMRGCPARHSPIGAPLLGWLTHVGRASCHRGLWQAFVMGHSLEINGREVSV